MWTVEAGRLLVLDGRPICNLARYDGVEPTFVDQLAHQIAAALNAPQRLQMADGASKLRITLAYPVVDAHPEFARKNRAVWTGERRPAKAGEWFLSGAVIEAYRAPDDIAQIVPIARIVPIDQIRT